MSVYSNLILQDSEENRYRLKLGILQPHLIQVLDESRSINWSEPMDFSAYRNWFSREPPFFYLELILFAFNLNQGEKKKKKGGIIVIMCIII